MRNRVFALCLTILLLCGALTACGESAENTEETAAVPSVDPETAAQEEETESATPHWDAVRKEDLGGITINTTCDEFDSNYYNVVDWDEISGEMLADAMYNRNRYVEEQLNCTLSVSYGEEVHKLEQCVISGSLPIVSQKTLAFLQRGLMKRLLPVSGEADRTVHIAAVCRHERGGGGALTGVACKPGSRQLSLQLFLCQGQCFWRTSSSGHPLQEAGPIVLPDQRFKSAMIGTDFLHVNPVWMFCEFCGQFPQTDRADATGFTNQIHRLIFRRVFLLQGRPAQLHSLIPDTAPRIADSADLPLLAG